MSKFLWEILVPTVRPNTNATRYFTTRYHRVWDKKVRDITGGLTIGAPARGQWVSAGKVLFAERVIPVRIMCTRDQIEQIATMTLDYYEQEAVMYYKVSDDVQVAIHPTRKNLS